MGWIVLLLLAAGGYWGFKLKNRWDMELVRSHVFLDALATGEPLDEANSTAMVVMAMPSVKGIQHLAQVHVLHDFAGQRGAMIQRAYQLGMTKRLSAYEQEFFGVKSPIAQKPRPTHHSGNSSTNQNGGGVQVQANGQATSQSSDAASRYKAYYNIYVEELRRLAGTAEGKIHPVQICEDDNVRLAFADRIDPYRLAAMVHAANYAA